MCLNLERSEEIIGFTMMLFVSNQENRSRLLVLFLIIRSKSSNMQIVYIINNINITILKNIYGDVYYLLCKEYFFEYNVL